MQSAGQSGDTMAGGAPAEGATATPMAAATAAAAAAAPSLPPPSSLPPPAPLPPQNGDEDPSQPGLYGHPGLTTLSQLSDLVTDLPDGASPRPEGAGGEGTANDGGAAAAGAGAPAGANNNAARAASAGPGLSRFAAGTGVLANYSQEFGVGGGVGAGGISALPSSSQQQAAQRAHQQQQLLPSQVLLPSQIQLLPASQEQQQQQGGAILPSQTQLFNLLPSQMLPPSSLKAEANGKSRLPLSSPTRSPATAAGKRKLVLVSTDGAGAANDVGGGNAASHAALRRIRDEIEENGGDGEKKDTESDVEAADAVAALASSRPVGGGQRRRSPAATSPPPTSPSGRGGANTGAGATGRSRAARRGPMDEMRQLVRILLKLLPQSAAHVSGTADDGGGNRLSEDQIKAYLAATLGEAPPPPWGLPEGWPSYLAALFSWARRSALPGGDGAEAGERGEAAAAAAAAAGAAFSAAAAALLPRHGGITPALIAA